MKRKEQKKLCQITVIQVWLEEEYPRQEEERPG